jgi:hypothetical protein
MTMGWMETIRYLGLDLQVATMLAVAVVDFGARAARSAWHRSARVAASRVPARRAGLPSAPALTPLVPRPPSQRFATSPGRP